ncbi:MAG: type II toxin-antitoxin system VapC family toxin [Candidatus Sumerlaeia bacterium]
MRLFLDSSAFAKHFIEEPGSAQVESLISSADELCLSAICLPEIVSALSRRCREKSMTRKQYALAKQRLVQDVRDAIVVEITPDVVQLSIEVLEKNSVRTLDAIHVACALASGADLFASSDHRQIAAARRAKIKTKTI